MKRQSVMDEQPSRAKPVSGPILSQYRSDTDTGSISLILIPDTGIGQTLVNMLHDIGIMAITKVIKHYSADKY